ncbi:uncharacterized protein LOC121394559 isoform X1 [Xenopus laevis]|uniref:Uncharacterized protein LOC121394559 isoform X1 n=1 Tax=Xenopus laevis TaxID=8355 RepID=A0A8J1KX56_XENLA|nr:uncharacterized protein LOC121394559 isoform X1 [Xenopus laevis]
MTAEHCLSYKLCYQTRRWQFLALAVNFSFYPSVFSALKKDCSNSDGFPRPMRISHAQKRLALSNMKLEIKEDSIYAATAEDPGFLPLILYIAIAGLHLLKKD